MDVVINAALLIYECTLLRYDGETWRVFKDMYGSESEVWIFNVKQKLQNDKKGTKSVNEYVNEIYSGELIIWLY